MQNCRFGPYLLLSVIAALTLLSAAFVAAAQSNDRPWMNSSLSPGERADLVLKQLTLDEKLALLHGNGMAHAPQWQMPLSNLSNGGAGYVEGVKRLGIPPLVISDAGYGVRDSGANGRYSTAKPSSLGAAASWDIDSTSSNNASLTVAFRCNESRIAATGTMTKEHDSCLQHRIMETLN